jgi:hypothetical protein
MTQQIKFLHQLQKGIQLEIVTPNINIEISKGQLNSLIAEAMTDPLASNAIKRILNPFLASSFTQFPTFTNITLGDTDADGITTVVLRQPKQSTAIAKPSAGIIEEESTYPVELNETEPEDEADSEPETDEVVESPAYVG